MPYLNEDELASLHQTVDKSEQDLQDTKKELEEVSEDLEDANSKLDDYDEDIKKIEKSKTIQNIILSLLAGIALALAYYFYSTGGGSNSNININEIKQLEATRVLDSINSLSINEVNSLNSNSISVDDSIGSIKNNINGEKIYSVQVGAFSENQYTLLSETLAGISSNGDLFKYSIGLFKTLKEAQDFRKELIKIGFSDAFVASYINGVRQRIEDPNN